MLPGALLREGDALSATTRCTSVLVLMLALGWLVACGSESGKAPEAGGAGAVAGADAPAGGSLDLPSTFPSDVPRYPSGRVTSYRVDPNQQEGLAVTVETDDATDSVLAFYADGLAAQGWSTDIREDADQGHTIFADKGSRIVTAVVYGRGGGTTVDLLIARLD